MPQDNDDAGDDLGSTDEVKVFKDEGEGCSEGENGAENLTEEKSSLIHESEEKSSTENFSTRKDAHHDLVCGKADPTPHSSPFSVSYLVSSYPYSHRSAAPHPATVASKMGLPPSHPGMPFPFPYHNKYLSQPPPTYIGIPPFQPDHKGMVSGAMGEYWKGTDLGFRTTLAQNNPPSNQVPTFTDSKRFNPLLPASGLRPPLYPFTTSDYSYTMFSPRLSQVVSPWYPISTASTVFHSPYHLPLPPITSLPSDFYRFPQNDLITSTKFKSQGMNPQTSVSQSVSMIPGQKQKMQLPHSFEHDRRPSSLEQKSSMSCGGNITKSQDSRQATINHHEKKKAHIKKPLNAFMLYMKEMRPKVVAECTLKESAAINQILGKQWHSLSREEQAKYYEMARQARQQHMQLYPDWSSRTNYSRHKKKKRRQEISDSNNSMKKCRAKYGLDQQQKWCKPCQRKKKCIRYMKSGDCIGDDNHSEDNSSRGAPDMLAPSEDDRFSLPNSLSSPGGLSGLSSLSSPSMILPSPASLASPLGSLASPCMSLQSPLTPHFDSSDLPMHPLPLVRNPVGTNPHDINNPLSVKQLTGECVTSDSLRVDQMTGQCLRAELYIKTESSDSSEKGPSSSDSAICVT